jgi:uncharacterized protein (DUF433 family)
MPDQQGPARDVGAQKEERLSAIIQELNDRFGAGLTEKDRISLEHLESQLTGDASLQAAARSNTRENVRLTFEQRAKDQSCRTWRRRTSICTSELRMTGRSGRRCWISCSRGSGGGGKGRAEDMEPATVRCYHLASQMPVRLRTGGTMSTSITSDPAVMQGKPVVAGTRVTVESILEKLAAGETIDQILDAHPRLSRDAVQAALAFAAQALRADVTYPVPDEAA